MASGHTSSADRRPEGNIVQKSARPGKVVDAGHGAFVFKGTTHFWSSNLHITEKSNSIIALFAAIEKSDAPAALTAREAIAR